MKKLKKVFILMSVLILSASLYSQGKKTDSVKEQEYLSSMEDLIIVELSSAQDYDSKILALDYIEKAIKAERRSSAIDNSLKMLASEGTIKESRTDGRISNDFPDIRARACFLLGEIGNEQAKNVLTEIVPVEKEPMVTIAAIKALGKMCKENSDAVIEAISWAEKKFSVKTPSQSLAFEVLNAYEKLAPYVTDKTEMINSTSEISLNSFYQRAIREKADKLLISLKKDSQKK